MEIQEWKEDIVSRATREISFRNNMSKAETTELSLVLFDFLEDGITILRNWRKLKDDTEFLAGIHNGGLVNFLKDKYNANGRENFQNYSSGGVTSSMRNTPESRLKSTCKQVI